MSDPLDLDAIEHRIRDCSTYNFGLRNADRLAKEDAPALIAALKEARARVAAAWDEGSVAGRNREHHTNMTREQAEATWPNPYLDRTETP